MLVCPRAYGSLLNVESASPRIMVTTFNGNPKTTIISYYSLTNCSDNIEAIESYRMLQDVIRQLPKPVIIIAGDMDAQLGLKYIAGFSFHDKTNSNSNLLLDLTKERELVSISTKFQNEKRRLWTHTYPNGERAQLDYILINKKWKNRAMDCQFYNTICSVQSDHRPCTAKICLSLRTCQMPKTKKVPYDWSGLQMDTEVKSRYTINVKKKKKKKRFQAFQINKDENSANTIHNNIIQAHREAAEVHVPHYRRNKKSLREGKKVVEKRGVLQDIPKGTSEEVRPKASEAEDAKYLDRADAEQQEE